MEITNIIVVKQLPVIEEDLLSIKQKIKERTEIVQSLVCTEDNYKEIKKARTEMKKEFDSFETRRKEIKKQITDPYTHFEEVYRDCVANAYKTADEILSGKIAEVENGLKQKKTDEVKDYFDEYAESLKIDKNLTSFERSGIVVNMTVTIKNLKEQAKEYLDRIDSDLMLIGTQPHAEEIMVEYRKSLNASSAILAVNERYKAIEEEKKRQEALAEQRRKLAEEQAAREKAIAEERARAELEEALSAPTETEQALSAPVEEKEEAPKEEKMLTITFKVTSTREKLIALRTYLEREGIKYE